MQDDVEDLENEEPEEFEDKSIAVLCGAPRVPHKLNKKIQTMIVDLVDRVRREDACKTAKVQDSTRRYVASNRYDVNSYPGGPATIGDLCFVKKRKVR